MSWYPTDARREDGAFKDSEYRRVARALFNSSGQISAIATRHNFQIQQGVPPIGSEPLDFLQRIQSQPDMLFHLVFTSLFANTRPITIRGNLFTFDDDQRDEQLLSLLSVSYRMRSLSKPILYTQGNFVIEVRDYNATASREWYAEYLVHRQKAEEYRPNSSAWVEYSSQGFTYKMLGSGVWECTKVKIALSGRPSWTNLVRWLYHWYTGALPAFLGAAIEGDRESVYNRSIEAAFVTLAKLQQSEDWSIAEKSLDGIRTFLAVTDPRWLADEEQSATDSEIDDHADIEDIKDNYESAHGHDNEDDDNHNHDHGHNYDRDYDHDMKDREDSDEFAGDDWREDEDDSVDGEEEIVIKTEPSMEEPELGLTDPWNQCLEAMKKFA